MAESNEMPVWYEQAENQLEWVRRMNNIKASAEEIVLKELIYS